MQAHSSWSGVRLTRCMPGGAGLEVHSSALLAEPCKGGSQEVSG
jgi:hypothetical protein